MRKATFARLGAIGTVVVLSTGCGFEKSVYDIELNEAEQSAVPFVCDNGRKGFSAAWEVSTKQRWTITAGEHGDTRIEVPGYFRTQLHGGPLDETPFIVNGTSVERGPFQFMGLETLVKDDTGSGTVVQRFVIEGDSLEADRIQGFIDLRTEVMDANFDTPTCHYVVSFTGRRVD
ncbi:hypothetical protein [Myxococcus fulvus]|uniref:hypothetical protein n=1 Tax=Myxococcus fulvus TaxID=33 RepID=UPI0020C1871A|nr:hypothetical protein [Myxococcus fulvus]MCK8503326.1 hypothetical protein [Myxococcus fulvus]